MKTIYICSRLKNRALNHQITKFLETKGFLVHLPERDTPQSNPEGNFTGNLTAIRQCDLFLAVLKGGGLDFGFEVGYAFCLGKPILGFLEDGSYRKDPMLAGAISKTVDSLEKLGDALANK
jgi:nucleoside 2-deoxyribosyltransferase